ncbi:MAG TPA: hypothetical protein VH916_13590 [Dehalococcoidia bacterium]|jgi:hypothetical protein
MSHHEPRDFLMGRALHASHRAEQVRAANAGRREQAERVRRRAQSAVLLAHLFSAHATDLVAHSRTLLTDRPPVTLDATVRARLAEDELWRRRLAKRLKQRHSG